MIKASGFILLFLFFFCCLTYFNACDLCAQPAHVAELIYMKGAVKIKAVNAADWVNAQVGMALKQGDVIKTEDGAGAELAFGEGLKNVINVFPNSQLIISSFEPGLVKLESGRIFSLIKKLDKGSTFEVRTPTAVAGARGTGWGTYVNNGNTEISGFEHSIYAAGLKADGTLVDLKNITEGWKILVAAGQGPGGLLRLSREDMAAWRKWKRIVLRHLKIYILKYGAQGDIAKVKELEEHATILKRVERETTRTDENKRSRRTQGGESGKNNYPTLNRD